MRMPRNAPAHQLFDRVRIGRNIGGEFAIWTIRALATTTQPQSPPTAPSTARACPPACRDHRDALIMDSAGEPIPISALQHAVYCLRQAALIHIERLWAENRFTAEGDVLDVPSLTKVAAGRGSRVRRSVRSASA